MNHNRASRKLGEEQVRYVREIHEQRIKLQRQLEMLPSLQLLADRYGVNRRTLLYIASGQTYKEIR